MKRGVRGLRDEWFLCTDVDKNYIAKKKTLTDVAAQSVGRRKRKKFFHVSDFKAANRCFSYFHVTNVEP